MKAFTIRHTTATWTTKFTTWRWSRDYYEIREQKIEKGRKRKVKEISEPNLFPINNVPTAVALSKDNMKKLNRKMMKMVKFQRN